MNYQTRLVLWAGKIDNVAQKETDGSTSYFFGQSHINVRTLSGTHAHRERKPAKRITTVRATPGVTSVVVRLDTAEFERKLAELRAGFGAFGRQVKAVADAMQAFAITAQAAMRLPNNWQQP